MKEVICIDDNFGQCYDMYDRPIPDAGQNPKKDEICQVIAVHYFHDGPYYCLKGYHPDDCFRAQHFPDITAFELAIRSALTAPAPKKELPIEA